MVIQVALRPAVAILDRAVSDALCPSVPPGVPASGGRRVGHPLRQAGAHPQVRSQGEDRCLSGVVWGGPADRRVQRGNARGPGTWDIDGSCVPGHNVAQ